MCQWYRRPAFGPIGGPLPGERMQKLHLVGFTPDLDGLILSTRKGAKSGSFVVAVDATVLKQLADANKNPDLDARSNGLGRGQGPRQSRPESQLGPREMQELLRGGWSLEEVAAEAGVDVDWVSRFAAPVLAEMRLVLDQARALVFDKPRVGTSALPLAASVRRNAAERGVRFTDEDFDDAWHAAQLDDGFWIVGFEYTSRGRRQSAEWTVDLELGEVVSRNRLGTQLGHVQSARRRINVAPPPKPKPKTKASPARASARTKSQPPPARRTATKAATRKTNVRQSKPAPRARARSSSGARKSTSTSARARKSAKPHAGTTVASTEPRVDAAVALERRDPWREELRRREAERAAVAAAVRRPEPKPERTPAASLARTELRPVAIIGPTVRTLARRSTRRRDDTPSVEPPPGLDFEDDEYEDGAGEEPIVLEWATKGPLPAPAPIAVPEHVREKVTQPLGQIDDDDDPEEVEDRVGEVQASHGDQAEDDQVGADDEAGDVQAGEDVHEDILEPWSPPARPNGPTFRGAQAATAPAPARRRRRSEPLRAR